MENRYFNDSIRSIERTVLQINKTISNIDRNISLLKDSNQINELQIKKDCLSKALECLNGNLNNNWENVGNPFTNENNGITLSNLNNPNAKWRSPKNNSKKINLKNRTSTPGPGPVNKTRKNRNN